VELVESGHEAGVMMGVTSALFASGRNDEWSL
jgi:hypothetical protein